MGTVRSDQSRVTRYRPLPPRGWLPIPGFNAVALWRWLVIGLFLAGWQLGAQLGLISQLFFPPPLVIVTTLLETLATVEFAQHLQATLLRTAGGVALGAGSGLIAAWLIGSSALIRTICEPIIAALHPLPKLAIFPILLVVLGIGEASKLALVAITAFFPLLITTLSGIRQIDDSLWNMAANFGARGANLVRHLILPASLPNALAGLKLALNGGLVVTIGIEMLSANRGLGTLIWLAWQTFRTEELYATLIVIGTLGVVGNALLDRLERRLLPWLTHHDAA